MKCPYRPEIEYEYLSRYERDKLGSTNDLRPVEKAQRTVFPDCYEEECPFYNSWALNSREKKCNRVIAETGDY